MSRASSLLFRGLLAIALMFGFYALAAVVAGGLLYIPYAEIVYFHRIDLRAAFFCVVAAGVVLWSVAPRPDRFEPPGPELEPSQQGELFRLLNSVR
jgi:heat shock protein HtpX